MVLLKDLDEVVYLLAGDRIGQDAVAIGVFYSKESVMNGGEGNLRGAIGLAHIVEVFCGELMDTDGGSGFGRIYWGEGDTADCAPALLYSAPYC